MINIHKPNLYLQHEAQFMAMRRENIGGPAYWADMARRGQPEVLPLLRWVWDLYFLEGHQRKEVDAALLCYSLVALFDVAYWMDRPASPPFILYASAAKDNIIPHASMWVQLDYIPYCTSGEPSGHYGAPWSGFGRYVKRLCDSIVLQDTLICSETAAGVGGEEERTVLLDVWGAVAGSRRPIPERCDRG